MFEKTSMDGQKNLEAMVSERPEARTLMPKTKKYIVIGVVSVIIVALFLIGLLVGIYLFTDTFHKIVSNSMQTGENTNQDTNVDQWANIVEYNVQDNGMSAIYVDDHNSYISVVKLTSTNGVVCYATPMNESQKTDLTKFDGKSDKVDGNSVYTYVKSKMPIPDTSFMNKKARSMCKGISIYWAYPVCQLAGEPTKQKRQSCGNTCNNICKLVGGRQICDDYCWVADLGCIIYNLF